MNSIPLHPLIVPVVVVLLPLGTLALIAAVINPRVRRPYGALIMIVTTVAIVSTLVALLSGQQLARLARPMPHQHAQLGTILLILGIGLLLVSWAWWLLWRRRDRVGYVLPGGPERILGLLVVPLALAALVFTGLTGYAGATATWGGIAAAQASPTSAFPAPPPSAPSPTASPTSTPEPTAVEAVYSMVEVAQRDSSSNCWAVIDGGVYDLTSWISRHPGGRSRIINLCGTNASAQFSTQHGDDVQPKEQLPEFRIGRLI